MIHHLKYNLKVENSTMNKHKTYILSPTQKKRKLNREKKNKKSLKIKQVANEENFNN